MISTIIIVTSISTFLAIIVAMADKFLNNYGEYTITINNDRKIEIQGGMSLLASLSDNKIFIPSACGGKATCGLCKVQVIEGAGPILATEEPYLSQEERENNIRLSCQIKVRNDIKIVIPEELFNIKEYKTILQRKIDLTHDIKEFRLQLGIPSEITFKSGQYVQIKTRAYGKVKEIVERAYSISSKPTDKGILELIVRKVPNGICTTYLHDFIEEQDDVILTGPFGDFYIREGADTLVFIAGGSGLAPIKSMIFDLLEKNTTKKMYLFFGAVTKKDLFYYDLFKDIEKKHKNFHYLPGLSSPTEEDKWNGETGLITDIVAKHIKTSINHQSYLCGSPGMINACINVLIKIGFSEDVIFYDKF